MRVAFFGTPEFAVAALQVLRSSRHEVVAVVTQRDRPRGRGLDSEPSPVKRAAIALGAPVWEPERLDDGFTSRLGLERPDALAVVAYGKIFRSDLLDLAPHGAINVHASLLPRHRGASPIQAALLAGDEETGVTTMQMDAGLDTGAVLLRTVVAIAADDDAGTLGARLGALGAELLVETLDRLERGGLEGVPQDNSLASYSGKIRPEDARLEWVQPASDLARRVRAFRPRPGAWTLARGRRLKILRATASPEPSSARPGTVTLLGRSGIEVACGTGTLVILEAQPEGKRAMLAEDLGNGRALVEGQILGA